MAATSTTKPKLDEAFIPDRPTPERMTGVQLQRTFIPPTSDLILWTVIRGSANALGFNQYKAFMDSVMCGKNPGDAGGNKMAHTSPEAISNRAVLPFPDIESYRLLKAGTEVFMMVFSGVDIAGEVKAERIGVDFFKNLKGLSAPHEFRAEEAAREAFLGYPGVPANPVECEYYYRQYLQGVFKGVSLGDDAPGEGDSLKTLPYLALIRQKLGDVALKASPKDGLAVERCYGILQDKLTKPLFLELIWSYWHEEAMLVQTLNTISLRFQNRRSGPGRDPLAQYEIDPLRPLNNILWGYIQDEQHRLTLPRRAYEYLHHYGISLQGKAVPHLEAAETRTRFLEAFHNLLNVTSKFYKQDDDTTVVADGFPTLNALKEVHLLLAEGAHNQYGDLPWTARQEMLMQEWILARPEMREFLPTRIMVAYPEPWMDRVDAMKKLQNWDNTSSLHYRDLAVFGEQILLSIRFGNWSPIFIPENAANWARYWRPEIQGYIHAYRTVTGVDLSADKVTADKVDYQMPSMHLVKRLAQQHQAARQ